jgi:putative FmdB family regulatory protein
LSAVRHLLVERIDRSLGREQVRKGGLPPLLSYNPSMPIYEYECRKCGAHTEAFQKVSDKPLTKCRKCGGKLEKKVSAPAIQFKGSGWYVTDYAGKRSQNPSQHRNQNLTRPRRRPKRAPPLKRLPISLHPPRPQPAIKAFQV